MDFSCNCCFGTFYQENFSSKLISIHGHLCSKFECNELNSNDNFLSVWKRFPKNLRSAQTQRTQTLVRCIEVSSSVMFVVCM